MDDLAFFSVTSLAMQLVMQRNVTIPLVSKTDTALRRDLV